MVKKKHINDEPCDKEVVNIDVNDIDKNEFEKLYVHEIYENISIHFSHTRYGPWKNVVKIINSVEKNSVILDVGCGNGKYLDMRDDSYFLGIDVCKSLLQICIERGKTNLLLSNNLRLPVKDNISDLTLSIAVIHHMSTLNRRLEAIRELIRCTKPKGKILIYVWSFEQDKNYIGYREFSSQDVLVPWNLQSVYSNNSCNSNNNSNSGEIKEMEKDINNININNNTENNTSSNNTTTTEKGTEYPKSETNKPIVEEVIKEATITTPKQHEPREYIPTTSPNKDLNYKRYYHVFKKEEIFDICNHFNGLVEFNVYTDCNNWVIEMCKL